jgi:hypothetical protein
MIKVLTLNSASVCSTSAHSMRWANSVNSSDQCQEKQHRSVVASNGPRRDFVAGRSD